MGVISIVLSMLGICICWLPHVGWFGVILGVAGCGIGMLAITVWYPRPGYTGWGIAGIVTGGFAVSVGTAFQIKHGAGNLDMLYFPIYSFPAICLAGSALAIAAGGLWIARVKFRRIGIGIALLSLIAATVISTSALVSADKRLAGPSRETAGPTASPS
ncbi:MAG: hypothetical protein QNJ97_04870 [Myxococcota bacterium]|nr:hypothetical protein [Myxococcota bacterium]